MFDFSGRLLHSESRRDFSQAELRKLILDCGTPVIVASDVNPVPKRVRKIASAFGARVIVPDGILDWRDRRRLLAEIPAEWKNAHEKDAAVAGWYAFKRVRGRWGNGSGSRPGAIVSYLKK